MWFLAWFANPIARWLAIIGIGILTVTAAAGGGVLYGWASCTSAAEVKQLKEAVAWLNRDIAAREARTTADNLQREADRAELERMDAKIKELTNAEADRECLSSPDLDRLRQLWNQAR